MDSSKSDALNVQLQVFMVTIWMGEKQEQAAVISSLVQLVLLNHIISLIS